MRKIVPIVEGPGEVDAVPKLLNKVLADLSRNGILVAPPKNAHGVGNLAGHGGLELGENEMRIRNGLFPYKDSIAELGVTGRDCSRVY